MSPHQPEANHIICIGAVYIDTILTVPHFPQEDTKLRAQKMTRRRGGNTANSLEVLAQLIEHEPAAYRGNPRIPDRPDTELHLIAVLPDYASEASRFITASLPGVNLEQSIYRRDNSDAASSYIIQSQATLSRTIVSINPLPEMTVEEFQINLSSIKHSAGSSLPKPQTYWIHFEGRVPDVTLQCVQLLRREHTGFRVSVECEKPDREGMRDVARLADVVFYSRLWAETNGFSDARAFLESQMHETREGGLLCCTWGAGGATIVRKDSDGGNEWADTGVWKPARAENGAGEVVDTIGAGDTFIAGMLFAINNHEEWPLQKKLEFTNELAGRKVLQEGFGGLSGKMW
ncbi:hypothetical protein NX059_005350 [Plenodomus lindquistii]|nr:hypothetical protein NX059_005350 [Plenodomus lindquistii]